MTPRLTAIACVLGLMLMVGAARAELVVVVAAQSPVDALSRTELTDIYLGRMNRLATGDPVIPIDQADRSPAYTEFYGKYLGQSTAQVKAHWSRLIFTGRGQPPRSVENSAAAAELVAGNPNAIAYVTVDAVDDRLRIVTLE